MAKKSKVINVNNMPSSFRGTKTEDGRFIQTGTPPIGGVYDKVAKTAGLTRLGNELLYNGANNIVPSKTRENLMDNTIGKFINYIKSSNNPIPDNNDLGPTFPFNIFTTPNTNGKQLPQKQYATGGKVPNVVEGGIAKPIGKNLFYMAGRKHSQGGIDIGPSNKTGIEVEDGEVVETNNNELKVYSAQPILNGNSPAQLVMGGVNPNKVFNAQENYKDRNRIKDDGTKYKTGGLSRDKDYSSKKKPYPNVEKKDFAGRNRSYPIPIKADARDALRLAGLHGRSDIKAKVYSKYPELRKKGSNGLIVNVNGNVKNGLIHSPSSTGRRNDKLVGGGIRKGGVYYYNKEYGPYISEYEVDGITRASDPSLNNYANINTNRKAISIDEGNRRPQYYAERSLPLFNDGAGITSGLVRAGWSHKANNNNKFSYNVNIPNLPPRKGSNGHKVRTKVTAKAGNTNLTISKQPPKATYNNNLPKVAANIPTKLSINSNVTSNNSSTKNNERGYGKFKNVTTADLIGLGSNLIGSVGSYFATKRAINKTKGPNKPTLVGAAKLKTKHNINPQLDRIREDKFEAYRDIDSNTASSRVGLARKQRVRNVTSQAVNQLYGNKENIETELINKDRLNQQSTRQFNTQQYNQYLDRRAAFNNNINEAKMNNINNLFTGVNAGIQDMIGRYENRKALNNTVGAMSAAAPNVDDRIMRDAGVDYDEFVIRKRRKLGGR